MDDIRGVLQVFSKPPAPGLVKRRLIPALGEAGAADLYQRLLRHSLATATLSGFTTVELWSTDVTAGNIRALAGQYGIRLQQQQGNDLGQRMSRALSTALARAKFALLMGCDCPALGASDLRQAAGWLRAGADAVLGPASDGGYYLIGLRRPVLGLFEDVPWGTAEVLETTRQRLRRAGLAWHELPEYADIDRPEDLELLPPEHDWGIIGRV